MTEMTKNAIVSEEMANKFATEKESPYTNWVRREGLETERGGGLPAGQGG